MWCGNKQNVFFIRLLIYISNIISIYMDFTQIKTDVLGFLIKDSDKSQLTQVFLHFRQSMCAYWLVICVVYDLLIGRLCGICCV